MSQIPNRVRRPWWALGAGVISAAILTVVYAALLVSNIVKMTTDPVQWWNYAFVVVALGLIVSGVSSIVYFARQGLIKR